MLGSNAAGVAGEIFQVALREPWDNPWLGSAPDGSAQTIAIAIGHYERAATEDIITPLPRSRTGGGSVVGSLPLSIAR